MDAYVRSKAIGWIDRWIHSFTLITSKILSFRFIRFHLPCQPTSTSLLKCAHVVKLAGCPPFRPSGSDYRYREKLKINFLSAAINSSVWALDCRICMFYRTDPVRISNYKVTKEQPFRRNRQRLPKTSPSILRVSYLPSLSVPLTWLSKHFPAEKVLLLHVSNTVRNKNSAELFSPIGL